MTIHELLAQGPSFSFEFFPPKTEQGAQNLWRVISEELAPLEPTFVSVTYGAGGSHSDTTVDLVRRIATETSITPMAHLTTVMSTTERVDAVVRDLAAAGVRDILALRGDPPAAQPDYDRSADSFGHAIDLVRFLAEHPAAEFSIGIAAFPEKHPLASDLDTDVAYFVEKAAAGAHFAITQFFFDDVHYWNFVELARAKGLPADFPVIPGIMPVTNVAQIERMAQLSGAEFPDWLSRKLHAKDDDPDAMWRIGVDEATEMCRRLLDAGAPGLHFFTLNKSPATREISRNLGVLTQR